MTPPLITETYNDKPVVYAVEWIASRCKDDVDPEDHRTLIGVFTTVAAAKAHAEGYVAWTAANTGQQDKFDPAVPWKWQDMSDGYGVLWVYDQGLGLWVFVSSEPINIRKNPDGTDTYLP